MTSMEKPSVASRQLRQQAALVDFGTYALQEPLLCNILKEAARVCADTLDVPFSTVRRYRRTENDLLIEAGHGWRECVIGRVSEANDSNPQGRAYITGQPVIIPNVRDAGNLVLHPLHEQHGIVSTANVIIKGQNDSPYGVLEIDSPAQHNYSEHDVAVLTGFADVLSKIFIIFERKNAIDNTQDQMRELITMKNMLVANNSALLAEKSVLVIENHKLLNERKMMIEDCEFRVHNNLQVIYSMLANHLNIETNGLQKASIRRTIRRVMTMPDIYRQLFSGMTGSNIDFGAYLISLCASLPSLQANTNPNIRLTCTSESLTVNIDTVTAIGMAIAELVSNSYEHAFGSAAGTINVAVRRSGLEQAVLTISDNGIGFIEQAGSKRHGVGLVRRLIEQVSGSVEHRSERGTTWTLRFPAVTPARDKRTLH